MKNIKKKKQPKNAPPNFYDFLRACVHDHSLALKMLASDPEWIRARSGDETALHYLAVENHVEAVRFLVAQGAHVDTRDNSEFTPLMAAAHLGHEEMCLLLLQHGANPNKHDNCDDTPMHLSSRSGHAEILDALLTAGGRGDWRGLASKSVAQEALPRKRELILEVLRKHGYK